MPEYPGGYQAPGLPPMSPFPSPFPTELGAFGPLAYMGLQSSGLLPPNLMNLSFTPATDVYNQFQSIRQFQDRTAAMKIGASGDIQTMMRYQESVARASGANWGQLQGRAAAASGWIGSMLPILSMIMPETVDMMMGPQGSQTVMASQLSNASRFMYDQSSGRVGMTGAETGVMSTLLRQQLFGDDAATLRMRGIGQGRAGILMNDMLSRGLIAGSPFHSEESLQAANIANVAGMVGGSSGTGFLGNLATSGTSRVDPSKVSQMGEQVRGMAKIVSAISDLFGSNGQANAPMPQLLAALDQLGQGAEYRYGSGQVESMFRNLQQATVTGRISLPQISQMVSQNAAMLSSVGGDPRDAIAMTQRAVNYASSAMDTFSGSFFGKMDPRSLAMASSSLEAAGVNSPAGQMAQIALYLADSSPGLAGNNEFGQLVNAVRSGSTTYAGGKSVLTALQGQNLRGIYESAGGNVGNFNAAAMNPEVARRYTGEVASSIRRLQLTEATQMAAGYIGGDLGSVFGISDAGARTAAGQGLITSLFAQGGKFAAMKPSEQAAMIESLAAESAASATGTSVDAMRQAAKGRGAGILASLSGAMTQFTGRDLQGALQLFSPEAMRGEAGRTSANRIAADISSALGDLGRHTFSQRLASALQNMNPNEDISNVISRVMGGVDKNKIEAALTPEMRKILNTNLQAIRAGNNPEAIEILKTQFSTFSDTLKATTGLDLATMSKAFDAGVDAMPGLMGGVSMLAGGTSVGSILGGGGNAMRSSGGNQIVMTITGDLNITDDGKAKLSGTGTAEGIAVGGAVGGAKK